jgi:GxxExxY protein
MANIILKEESYDIIGACIEVHNMLGFGFREIIYKDALECEFELRSIPFEREKLFKIIYKERILPRKYAADFIVFGAIILEIKAKPIIINDFVLQTRNYLKAAGLQLGIIANFGESSFKFQRVVL